MEKSSAKVVPPKIDEGGKVKEIRTARIKEIAKEQDSFLAEEAGRNAVVTTYKNSNRVDIAIYETGVVLTGINIQSWYRTQDGYEYQLLDLLDFSEFNAVKETKPKKADKSEDNFQQICYTWFHNTYPQFRGLLCYNLGNSRNKIDGARNRNKGLQAGRSDFTFYWSGRAFFIELKTPVGTKGKAQLKWAELVMKHGFDYYIVRDLETFKVLVKGIMNEEHSV